MLFLVPSTLQLFTHTKPPLQASILEKSIACNLHRTQNNTKDIEVEAKRKQDQKLEVTVEFPKPKRSLVSKKIKFRSWKSIGKDRRSCRLKIQDQLGVLIGNQNGKDGIK
jgi:hypothetical protein